MQTTDPIDQGIEDCFDDGRDDWIQDCRPCKKPPNTLVEWGLDCPNCINEENQRDADQGDDCAYERDERDPVYWRTNQTELFNELEEHAPDCRCAYCGDGEPLYDREG